MGSRRLGIAVIAAWLGLAVLGGAQATGNFPRQRINPEFARALAWHRSTLEPAALDALAALPAAERKQRLDAVIAANPDDPVAHLIRASADYELDDAAGTLRDVDAVLAAGVPVESVEGAVFALRAEALMDLGRNAEALADSERAVAADANGQYVSTRFSHGWALHLVRHDDALALRELDAALAREPDEAAGAWRRGQVLLSLGQAERAQADLQHAVDLQPDHAPWRLDLANCQIQLSKDDPARAQLDAAIRLAPDWMPPLATRARLDVMQERDDDAIADATRALALGGPVRDRADAYLSRARAWEGRHDDARQLADLAAGEALAPGRADFAMQRGIHEREQGQLVQAKASLTHALALDPRCAICLSERALVQAHLGDREAALADARQAVDVAPDMALAHESYGDILMLLHDYSGALAEQDAAVRLAPGLARPRINRGEAHEALGDHAAAIAEYTDVLAHFPSSQDGIALVDRGMARSGVSDLVGAIADFRAACAALPGIADPWFKLGYALQRHDDFGAAADAYAQGLTLRPDDVFEFELGKARLLSGRFAEAVEPLRAGLRRPGSPSAYAPLWVYLSRIRARAGDDGDARAELARLASPHDPPAWTDALADFMLGRIDAGILQRRADEGPADKRVGRRCEADYYVAEIALAGDRRADALPLLARAVRGCPGDYFEATAARAESRLQGVADRDD